VVIGDGDDVTAVRVGCPATAALEVVAGLELEVLVEVTAAEAFDADEPLWASAGSWPVTSCTRIPPVVARNVPAARPATRRRIKRTWRRRCTSRSAGVGESIGFTPIKVQGVIRSAVTVA
jgi:hypothetical protein